MKTKLFGLFFLVTSVLLTGCHNKDDDGNNTATLNGTWHMRNVMGGFVGVDIDFDRNVVVWIFNDSTQILSVENNVDTSDTNYPFSGLPTGTYAFEVINMDGTLVLQIEGADQGEYIVTATTLTIDDRPADGYLRTFEK
ncbi:MAG: hypothetical protein R2786_09300 [Flavobacteriaceae bacterium]